LRFFLFRELQPALRQVDKDRAVIRVWTHSLIQ
jgi:hypothetical protein